MAIEEKNRDILLNNSEPTLQIKSTLGTEPSARYTSVLENTLKAVQDFWKNKDFVDGEKYAEVVVNKNISNIQDVSFFMNYLAEKDDILKPAEELGNWQLITGQSQGVNIKELENPKTQPSAAQAPPPSSDEINSQVKLSASQVSNLIYSQEFNTTGRKSFSSILEDLKKQGR